MIGRLQLERDNLKAISQSLEETVKSWEQTKSDAMGAEPQLSEDIKIALAQASLEFTHISEIIGGIKRATDAYIPWSDLKEISSILDDPSVLKHFDADIKTFLDKEIPLLIHSINELVQILENSLQIHTALRDSIAPALRLLTERHSQGDDLISEFKSIDPKNPDQTKLDSLMDAIEQYKLARENDHKLQLEAISPGTGKGSKIPYLRDAKKSLSIKLTDYREYFDEADTVSDKLTYCRNAIEAIVDDLKKTDDEHANIDSLSETFQDSAQLSVQLPKPFKKTLTNQRCAILSNIIQAAYDRRAILYMRELLSTKIPVISAHDRPSIEKLRNKAILEIIARIGELEKRSSFVPSEVSWVKARSTIYHTFDTDSGIRKYEKLILNKRIFSILEEIIAAKLQLVEGFIKKHVDLDGFCHDQIKSAESPSVILTSLLNELPAMLAHDTTRQDMLENQAPLKARLDYIQSIIEEMQSDIRQTYEENGLKVDALNKTILDKNPALGLSLSFDYKRAGEMLKFIQELDFSNEKSPIYSYYQANVDALHAYFDSIKESRGLLAHSANHIANYLLVALINDLFANGKQMLSELSQKVQKETIAPTVSSASQPN